MDLNNSEFTEVKKKRSSLFGRGSQENIAAVIVPICAVLIIAATLFLIISSFVETGVEPQIEDYYVTFYDEEADITYFLYKGKLIEGCVRGRCDDPYESSSMSLDGSVLALISTSDSGDYVLSAVTPTGVCMISDKADESESIASVSSDGRIVAYTLKDHGALYIYDVSDKKSKILTSDAVDCYEFTSNDKSIVYMTEEASVCLVEISSGKIKTVAEEVKEYAVLDGGAKIVYVDSEDTLFLYTDWSSSTEKIAKNVVSVSRSLGRKIFAYTTSSDNGEKTKSYLYNGSKTEKIGEDITVLGLDDKGEKIYFRDSDGDLILRRSENESETITDKSSPAVFNKDITEVFFLKDSGTYVYFAESGEKAKVSSSPYAYPINIWLGETGDLQESFADCFYLSKENGVTSILFVDAKYNAVNVIEDVQNFCLTESGEKIIVEKDGEILLIDSKKNFYNQKICDGELVDGSFFVTEDEKAVFMIKENEQKDTRSLYLCENGEKTLVSKKLVGDAYMSHDGYLFFFEDNEDEKDTEGYGLYCVKRNGEKDLVCENAVDFKVGKESVYVVVPRTKSNSDDDGDEEPGYSVLGCVKGSKFKVVIEKIFYSSDDKESFIG